MIEKMIISRIKRWKEQRNERHFRGSLYSRDKWIIDKFNLPDFSKAELRKINEVWPFVNATNDDLIWNRLYKMKYGFDPYFISDYQAQLIYSALNPIVDVEFLKNKALIDVYCSEIAFPKTYIKCLNGRLYDKECNEINESKAVEILKGIDDSNLIIKPSVNSGCGKGVCKIPIEKEAILNAMYDAGKNYIIQEYLKQCEFLSNLNKSSINTCRITSLFIDGRFSLSAILKIGKEGSVIDNWNSSYWLKIDEQGHLANTAFDYKLCEATASDSGVKFEGLVYPFFPLLISTIEKYHKKYFPTLGILGWDVFIDNHQNVRVIEVNPDYPEVKGTQFCVGTFFQGYRDTIVERIMNIRK